MSFRKRRDSAFLGLLDVNAFQRRESYVLERRDSAVAQRRDSAASVRRSSSVLLRRDSRVLNFLELSLVTSRDNKLFQLLDIDPYSDKKACEKFDDEAVVALLKRKPRLAAAKYQFRYGSKTRCVFPLQHALHHGASIHIVEALYEAFPIALAEINVTTVLHCLCTKTSAEVGVFVINSLPDFAFDAWVKDSDDDTPLHFAFHHNAPVEVLSKLLEFWPEDVWAQNTHGVTPLHMALATWDVSLENVSLLLEQYPDAAKEKDNEDKTPMHWACLRGFNGSTEHVSKLLDCYPDALGEKDHCGMTPLHCACHFGTCVRFANFKASLENLSLLLKRYPDAAKEKDHLGRMPLHWACFRGFSTSVQHILLILECCPHALGERDYDGKTPLHLACSGDAPLEVILILIEKCPKAIRVRDNKERSPLDIYEVRRYSEERTSQYAQKHKILSYVFQIFGERTKRVRPRKTKLRDEVLLVLDYPSIDDDKSKDIMQMFIEMKWFYGVALVLDHYPRLVNHLGINILPEILFMIGQQRRMTLIWRVVKHDPGILEDVDG
mmetsp:Transcript_20523/g.29770  ORF Transcript_20523/g.29770 Transcript_20523/m.29770 type:complete len:551 (+) Transcript_20523:78-1730(+)